jgi:phosphoserine aminotransferase
MSVLEISHRSKTFADILAKTEADLRALGGIQSTHKVLFLQGGASVQFSMVPMNLVTPGTTPDYIITGVWSQKALKEAQRVGPVNIAGSTESENFARIPGQSELKLNAGAAYVHFTSNNTIFGTQWASEPTPPAGVWLACDASSDVFSRPLDVTRYGVIYAGAQKNIGPAGVTLVIIRRDLASLSVRDLPTMLRYATHLKDGSLYNTPPSFGIYLMGRVFAWLERLGGLAAMEQKNREKAQVLYDALAELDFYRPHAGEGSRSLMNVTFTTPSKELDARFAKEAEAAGLSGLKGHRSVGGMRASIYNAMPLEGVHALVEFMREFERTHG